MITIRRLEDLAGFRRPLHLAIGVFDGFHLGHQAVWEAAAAGSLASGGTAVLVTFDPHPRTILVPDEAPPILTHTAHKLRIASRLGVSAALVVRFDSVFAAQSGEAFIRTLATHGPGLAEVCVGRDWQFGRNRSGNFTLLEKLGHELHFTATAIHPVSVDGSPVSSTRIRGLIGAGNLHGAKRLLGRDYSVFGSVTTGAQLGRRLGFPTANVEAENEQLPPDGVYAVRVLKGNESLDGVANLGRRPTVTAGSDIPVASRLEVHLLDWSGGDFYGENLEVEFVRCLRPESRFQDLDALVRQIRLDVSEAKRVLAESMVPD